MIKQGGPEEKININLRQKGHNQTKKEGIL